ncbi:MAG: D-alanyl-D-alanine carboxypeptidase [Holosporaceae bacterium]|jgi:D-alanyl-D-alanine carboxypeptidase|nr:D-alanyl-D-alanine carboxypeptidase [Holosporaceae bacterium]
MNIKSVVFSELKSAPALVSFGLRSLVAVALAFFPGEYSACSNCFPTSAAIVVDAKTGKIFYSRNAFLKSQPASLTKMMTLLLVFKALRSGKMSLRTPIVVSKNAASQQPCSLKLLAGDIITVHDAILATITKSANDAAVALAEYLGRGSEQCFVRLMNAEAKRLRMYSTIFMNASGWKNTEQLSTVFDMAKLARELVLTYPEYYSFFATKRFYHNKKCFKNHNNLLGNRGGITIDGIKTGFVCASGFNIAVAAKMKSIRLIAVVFGGETANSRDRYVYDLLCRGFAHSMHMANVNYHWNSGKLAGAKNNQQLALDADISADTPSMLGSDNVFGEREEKTKQSGILNKVFKIHDKEHEGVHPKKMRICSLLEKG